MPRNLLEQLGQRHVPAPPARLRQEVRLRMNTTLVTLHLADLALRGLPFAVAHFAQAVGGLLMFTLTGKYEPRVSDDARRDDQ